MDEHTWNIAPNNVIFLGSTISGDGSPDSSYLDMDDALGSIPDNRILIIKAGETTYFEENFLVLDRPITIKSRDGTIERY